MLRHAVADRRRYTRDVERHYLKALDGHATWVYAREVLGSSAWYEGLWRRRDRIARIPALLIWGMKDGARSSSAPRWSSCQTAAMARRKRGRPRRCGAWLRFSSGRGGEG
jgi:hypothetical protein